MLDSSQDKTNWIGTFTPGTPATATANVLPAVNRWNNQDQLDRHNLMTRVTPLQLSGKIHCDIFQQEKPLIPIVSLSIKFIRSRSALVSTALTANGIPKAVIRKPKLFVRKYEPSAGYMNALSKRLLRGPAVYHFERVQMRQSTLATGVQSAEWPNMVAGQLPKMMLITLASAPALSGSHDTNPLYFDHYSINHLSAEIDGKIYPSNGY